MNSPTTKQVSSCGASSETVSRSKHLLSDHAFRYANSLLKSLNCDERVDTVSDHPAIAWRRCGLLHTTKLMLPLPLAANVDGALMAMKAISPNTDLPLNGSVLLGERARLRGTVRHGRMCAGGYGRLLETRDGLIALNLVRDDDWDLIPAWLEEYITDWDGITAHVKTRETDVLTARAAEIGLAVSKDELPARPADWFSIQRFMKAKVPERPLVVDLSGLWAGPLASSLLQMSGANVIKVEAPNRPDGMRNGHQGFYRLLNAGKDCVALNFRDQDDLDQLKVLLDKADIVIEASRPRALRQLGIGAEEFVKQKPGKIWARITAYGQAENRIGFGDDIGISAGLASVMYKAHGEPCFVGDAIADPVNGIHVALAICTFQRQGGGAVLDFSMRDVLRHAMGDVPHNPTDVTKEWHAIANFDKSNLYPMRVPLGAIKKLGEDTARLC